MEQPTVAVNIDAAQTSDVILIKAVAIMSILSVNFARTSDKLDSILEVCAPEAAVPSMEITPVIICTTSTSDEHSASSILHRCHHFHTCSQLQPEPVHPSAPLTRLVATLGPNSSSVEQLTGLLQAGMQVISNTDMKCLSMPMCSEGITGSRAQYASVCHATCRSPGSTSHTAARCVVEHCDLLCSSCLGSTTVTPWHCCLRLLTDLCTSQ